LSRQYYNRVSKRRYRQFDVAPVDKTRESRRARSDRLSLTRTINLPRNTGMRGEYKTHDVAAGSYEMDTTGTIVCLNLIAAGTDYNQRIGRQIHIKAVKFSMYTYPQSTSAAGTKYKIMLIQDKQPNGALAGITDVLNAVHGTSQNNLQNRNRFRIIRAWSGVLGYYNETATQAMNSDNNTVNFEEYVKTSMVTTYNAATANIADITTNALLFLVCGTRATNSGYTLYGTVRVKFVEN
jgi:hypothetical protein